MAERLCDRCYYGDKCEYQQGCEDFTDYNLDTSDKYIENIIESNRKEYYAEWEKYVAEYND